jgi:putative spermidine/putrescine transport system permease protein
VKRVAGALLTIVFLLPFGLIAMLSAGRGWTYPSVVPSQWDFSAWLSSWRDHRALWRLFLDSSALSGTVALLSTAAAFLTAHYVAYHRRRTQLLIAAYLPYVMSPVVLGVCILYLYLRLGIDGTFFGVVLAQTILAFSFGIIFFVDFWNEQKLALEQLVYTLGGSAFDAYRRVLLPISRDALVLCFFQCFLISWYQYGLTLLIGGGRIQTLSTRVFDFVAEANLQYAAVSSVLLVLPPLALLWISKRISTRRA